RPASSMANAMANPLPSSAARPAARVSVSRTRKLLMGTRLSLLVRAAASNGMDTLVNFGVSDSCVPEQNAPPARSNPALRGPSRPDGAAPATIRRDSQHSQEPLLSSPIAFIDLQAQRRRIGPRMDEAIGRVLAHGGFILGPEVKEL